MPEPQLPSVEICMVDEEAALTGFVSTLAADFVTLSGAEFAVAAGAGTLMVGRGLVSTLFLFGGPLKSPAVHAAWIVSHLASQSLQFFEPVGPAFA